MPAAVFFMPISHWTRGKNMSKKSEPTYAQQFKSVFQSLCQRHGNRKVWDDFILMFACTISNAVYKITFGQRIEMYMRVCKEYSSDELDMMTQLCGFTILALEENQEQDFLGDLFTSMNLFNARKGQIFTPYPIAKLMATLTNGNLSEQIKEKGFVSVNDPACGAGVMLIAFANVARKQGVNYQRDIVFVAQDIDFTVALMCYVQLALIGCV
jgi:type I restriction-modification system DNA methylase subunit